ncbi:MAG: YtxH domain-containing protein [Dokdonia sp.]|jgi:gas vesicle protein
MSTNNTIIGVLSGIAVGAAIGVLLAPDKGENTRAKLASKSREAQLGLKDSLNDILDSLSEKYDVAKRTGADIKDAGAEIISKSKEELSKAGNEIANTSKKEYDKVRTKSKLRNTDISDITSEVAY